MRKIVFAVSSLLATTLLFTACNKEETYTVPAQNEIALINGVWLTMARGEEQNLNNTPDPDELTPIDTANQKVFTAFLGNGEVVSFGTFMGMDMDSTTGTWLITPDRFLKTTSPDVGAKNYYIYELNDSLMILKDVEARPVRWISYLKQ